ncbi:dihydropteroate synthase [Thalassobacillus devorans]|uniref:Dihydropteroate synthase n=1 Tax=Thalassobacillus devorans TaxID=279813 RepID=A0ABQ1PV68_9BACI|nr:dihydropteroate synthase [Thalassobacillus devorans]NIK30821.1 dihydropteroate synthase [Thalassobacillus devorans]GGD04516.1 dihydropteroate synthase [Thalassobacillus devorans]
MGFTLNTKKQVYDLDKKTLIMGILNVTPDSFSDGGKFSDLEKAVEQAAAMERDGADIIDIGGESTRPGHDPVSEREELERVLPVIKKLSSVLTIPISIDTYKAEVARQAVEAGADIINDVWAAKRDAKMAEVAASLNVPIILMHNRANTEYQNLIVDMKEDLKESITIAKEAGVREENIILDPGIGFAKNHDDNLVVMRHLDSFQELNYPMLLATSRKRFIGQILDLPAEERMEGTGATVCLGISKGVHMVRVHDVKPVARMAKMMDAMVGKGE